MLVYMQGAPSKREVRLSVATDFRAESPIKPGIVLNIMVPAGTEPATTADVAVAGFGSVAIPLQLAKAEYWVLSDGPRAAVPIAGFSSIRSMHDKAPTLYKIFFAVPAQVPAMFTVQFPGFGNSKSRFTLPALAFQRSDGNAGVELCRNLPGSP
ncbi:hypothetical protein [Ideonella azotifigens]|uniref:Uncharacterized protein n=2 Tax=Ideonella azotifigens TaxID=513160 RepID=A0ABP3VNY0_9BURK